GGPLAAFTADPAPFPPAMKTGVAPDHGTGSAIVNVTGLALVAPVTVKRGMRRASSPSRCALARSQSASPDPALARSADSTVGVNQIRGCVLADAGASAPIATNASGPAPRARIAGPGLSDRTPRRRPDEIETRAGAREMESLEHAAAVPIEQH